MCIYHAKKGEEKLTPQPIGSSKEADPCWHAFSFPDVTSLQERVSQQDGAVPSQGRLSPEF